MSSNKGDINATILNGFLKGDKGDTPVKGTDYWTDEDKAEIVQHLRDALERVTSLNSTPLDLHVINARGNLVFVKESMFDQFTQFGIDHKGWYVFARIAAKPETVLNGVTVTGAAGYVVNEASVDVAVEFEVAAVSKEVCVKWDASDDSSEETFAFMATDLAIRNLDYRVTFYVYDIADYAHWEFTPATDATFTAGKYYYLKDGDEYTLAEVTVGEAVPAVYYEDLYTLTEDETFTDGKTYYTESDGVYTAAEVTAGEAVTEDTYYEHAYVQTEDETFTDGKTYYTKSGSTYTQATVTAGEALPTLYYVHSKVTFEGMIRNVTYVCNTPIDCPVQFNLPVIEDDTHGAWFEIRFLHTGSFSSTLVVPEGVKVATEHTQPETAGFNSVDLHYSSIAGKKAWRFLNTHSTIPA